MIRKSANVWHLTVFFKKVKFKMSFIMEISENVLYNGNF
ncbi:hypothetical protein D593_0893 [Streptococcus intermedius BA1]|nr:hypothetical protein D593_0893 [Streptococcus intermedius BA1]